MSTSPQPSLMGRIAVSAKLITQTQLLEALRAQDHMGATKRLGDILLELGYISQAQLEWLVRAQATLVERQRLAKTEAEVAPASPPTERMLDHILTKAIQLHASDVHLHAGLPIQMRVC